MSRDTRGRRLVALLIDAGVVLEAVLLGVVLARVVRIVLASIRSTLPGVLDLALPLAACGLAVLVLALLRRGRRSPGARLVGLHPASARIDDEGTSGLLDLPQRAAATRPVPPPATAEPLLSGPAVVDMTMRAPDGTASGETFTEPDRTTPDVALHVLRFDDGEEHLLHGYALLGRRPEADAEPVSDVIALGDADRSLSKTHALIESGPDGVHVTDRFSTNGTVLLVGGGRQRLVAGERTAVPAGAEVRFGDRRARIEPVSVPHEAAGGRR